MSLDVRVFSIEEFITAYILQNKIQGIQNVNGVNMAFQFKSEDEAYKKFYKALTDPNNKILIEMIKKHGGDIV